MSDDALTLEEYKRYGRQMILEGFGLPGQLKLKKARVAVIGAGGLGCPALQYLAGAGVGHIGIFDFDKVESSNLHRQVLHNTERVGCYKAESAKLALEALNPHVEIIAHIEPILPSNAISLLESYSLILDCTDRPTTRYLMSDAAVRLGIVLVSGAAISMGGQWSVYGGHHRAGIPPPRTERTADYTTGGPGAGTCEEEGVFGPVVGVVGVQMASEAMKVILGLDDEEPRLNLLSLAPSSTPYRSVKTRGPSIKCIACGPNATVTDDLGAVPYEAFCGLTGVPEEEESRGGGQIPRIRVNALREALTSNTSAKNILIDTRQETEYGICSLPESSNIPMETFVKDPIKNVQSLLEESSAEDTAGANIYFLCRRGNDSLVSALALRNALQEADPGNSRNWQIRDVIGGVRAWSKDVDPHFPVY
ncbi:hypothetical protein QFC24_002867 [Naganishia onofrii]|uniref:Uncharacterized protein n=1 Tax=Naganishia onofrii TaxID=1851511 RepID=A0ACC2XQF8_9TREE|nr:hypothetical protein QFC24_002867 [Naganishia onofrii]